jgi:hypothetical protein
MHTSSPPLRAALKKIEKAYHVGALSRKALVTRALNMKHMKKTGFCLFGNPCEMRPEKRPSPR